MATCNGSLLVFIVILVLSLVIAPVGIQIIIMCGWSKLVSRCEMVSQACWAAV
jgi:hypothetical protein